MYDPWSLLVATLMVKDGLPVTEPSMLESAVDTMDVCPLMVRRHWTRVAAGLAETEHWSVMDDPVVTEYEVGEATTIGKPEIKIQKWRQPRQVRMKSK